MVLQGIAPLGISSDFNGFAYILQRVPRGMSLNPMNLDYFARGAPWHFIGFRWICMHFARSTPWGFIGFRGTCVYFAEGTP